MLWPLRVVHSPLQFHARSRCAHIRVLLCQHPVSGAANTSFCVLLPSYAEVPYQKYRRLEKLVRGVLHHFRYRGTVQRFDDEVPGLRLSPKLYQLACESPGFIRPGMPECREDSGNVLLCLGLGGLARPGLPLDHASQQRIEEGHGWPPWRGLSHSSPRICPRHSTPT